MNLNSIQFITPEEIEAMTDAELEVTKRTYVDRRTGVRRTAVTARLILDRLTEYPLKVDFDDFSLLHYHTKRKYVSDQFSVRAKVRIVETKWPERNGQKAHSSFKLDVYVSPILKWSEDITRDRFLHVVMAGIESGTLSNMKLFERIPAFKERGGDFPLPEQDELPF